MEPSIEVSGDKVIFKTMHGDRLLPISCRELQILHVYSSPVTYQCWLRNADGFYYHSLTLKKPKKINTETLIPVDRNYALADAHVVIRGDIIHETAADSFQGMGQFARDCRNVYALSDSREGLQLCNWTDMASILPIGTTEFFSDRFHLYRYNWHFIEQANHSTNRKLSQFCVSDPELRSLDRTIFGEEPTISCYLRTLHPQADAWWNWDDAYYRRLEHVSGRIWRNEALAFYQFHPDMCISESFPTSSLLFERFMMPDQRSFFSAIPMADPTRIRALDLLYSKDDNSVFYATRRILNADANTFDTIGNGFAMDGRCVYYNGHVCPEADRSSFVVINGQNAKDRNRTYSVRANRRLGKLRGYDHLLQPNRS